MQIEHDTRDFARAFGAGALALAIQLGSAVPAAAVDKLVNLDGSPGNESVVSLSLLSSSPIKVRNKITNKAVGKAFSFTWPSAGPGGFASAAGTPSNPGTASGVGVQWEWKTTYVIYSYTGATCPTDICFTQTFPAGPSLGPFGAPGRSLAPSGVTLSSGSLLTSLLTFFSPLTDLVQASSTVEQLESGEFRYRTIVQNLTAHEIAFEIHGLPFAARPSGTHAFPGISSTSDPASALLPPVIVVPAGGQFVECVKSPFPAVEIGLSATICGQDVPAGPHPCASSPDPASRGEFRALVPDSSQPVGSAFLTPVDVIVADQAPGGNGDGLLQPGETAGLSISIRNAGSVTVEDAIGTLSSPAIDLTDDGTANPAGISILSPTSGYPSVQGTPPTAPPGPCGSSLPAPLHPSSNTLPFTVQIPATHPRDVGRPFTLAVNGQLAGSQAPFFMSVPVVIAIADDAPQTVPALSAPVLAMTLLGFVAIALVVMTRLSAAGGTAPLSPH